MMVSLLLIMNIESAETDISAPENLAGQFVVWAVSEEAKPLRGKYLWSNWDVEELKQKMDKLSKPDQLTISLNGWPFDGSV